MRYLAVLGRQAEISIAELEALFCDVKKISDNLAEFSGEGTEAGLWPDINRLGGTLKIAERLESKPLEFLRGLPEGKITLGVSDYSRKSSKRTATVEALRLKKILVRHGRNVRVVENKEAVLSTATSLHNGLSGKNERKVELIKVGEVWYKVVGVQDIEAYAKRDQARPARDAKVGMLPPKLAQILINLCGKMPRGSKILDPFCGTGVVLQEAIIMGYYGYGTDIDERMVEYTRKNLIWLVDSRKKSGDDKNDELGFTVSQGDATKYKWDEGIDAVVCEGYLGRPMSQIPVEIKLKDEKWQCGAIIMGFLKNLSDQIKAGTPVIVAMPAWLREGGKYSRLEILDEIEKLGYNVSNRSRRGLLYHREGQIVARDIIILRKK